MPHSLCISHSDIKLYCRTGIPLFYYLCHKAIGQRLFSKTVTLSRTREHGEQANHRLCDLVLAQTRFNHHLSAWRQKSSFLVWSYTLSLSEWWRGKFLLLQSMACTGSFSFFFLKPKSVSLVVRLYHRNMVLSCVCVRACALACICVCACVLACFCLSMPSSFSSEYCGNPWSQGKNL